MKSTNTEDPFQVIVGSQLSAVCFVQDYVQLQFDGPVLTAVNCPVVRVGPNDYEFGMPDHRNKLCECIAKIVKRASVIEGQEIQIEFEDGSSISVSLRVPEEAGMAEMAIFDNGAGGQWVWN